MGARRGTDANVAAVCALRGPHRAGMDRSGRRRPREPRLLRRALGQGARRSRRQRADPALRADADPAPADRLWRARAARGAGRLHSRGARRRRAGTGGTVCRAQSRAGRRNRRAGAQGAPGRRARRRRRDCRVLFRTHSGRRSLARDVRALAQDGRAQPSATALPHARSVDASCGAFGDRRRCSPRRCALPVRTFRSNTDSRPDIRSTASR